MFFICFSTDPTGARSLANGNPNLKSSGLRLELQHDQPEARLILALIHVSPSFQPHQTTARRLLIPSPANFELGYKSKYFAQWQAPHVGRWRSRDKGLIGLSQRLLVRFSRAPCKKDDSWDQKIGPVEPEIHEGNARCTGHGDINALDAACFQKIPLAPATPRTIPPLEISSGLRLKALDTHSLTKHLHDLDILLSLCPACRSRAEKSSIREKFLLPLLHEGGLLRLHLQGELIIIAFALREEKTSG